jgi:hypothetical protein
VCALLGRARRARGCVTPGDDRLEMRAYAVKRYLFRLGHAARSGRYACSVEQLVVGLAPVMGWGEVPRGHSERARFVLAHRKSVQRWLDDLQAGGVAAHEPERDARGWWWRTQIVLRAAPAPTAEELRVAQYRARGWRARERGRARRRRSACALATIRSRASEPQRNTRRRLARARAGAAHEARRRVSVEAQILAGRGLAEDRGLLTHPFGAPPTSAHAQESSKRQEKGHTPHSWAPAAARSAQTLEGTPSFVAGTGAQPRAASDQALMATPADRQERNEEIAPMSAGELDALVLRRVARRERQVAERKALRLEHVVRRSQEVICWPQGRGCPFGRLTEAWIAHRYGSETAAETGAAAAGPRRRGLAGRAARAVALYEAFAEQRPPGWPEAGPAALCALAGQGRAAVLAGDVARLLALAKGMRGAALVGDPELLAARGGPSAPSTSRAARPRCVQDSLAALGERRAATRPCPRRAAAGRREPRRVAERCAGHASARPRRPPPGRARVDRPRPARRARRRRRPRRALPRRACPRPLGVAPRPGPAHPTQTGGRPGMTDHRQHRPHGSQGASTSSPRSRTSAHMRICASDQPRRDQPATRSGQLAPTSYDAGTRAPAQSCAPAPLGTCATARAGARPTWPAHLETASPATQRARSQHPSDAAPLRTFAAAHLGVSAYAQLCCCAHGHLFMVRELVGVAGVGWEGRS